jgi:hypothetical protein
MESHLFLKITTKTLLCCSAMDLGGDMKIVLFLK